MQARFTRAISFLLLLALAGNSSALMPPVPRKSPELTILEPNGKQHLLTSYRGKVVVLGIVHTTCIYCRALTVKLVKLQKELGPRGFQPLEVAWNEGAKDLIPEYVEKLGVKFPVGYSPWDPLMSYMGFSIMDRPVTPLVVVIDRKGVIRAQTPADGDSKLQNEESLRKLITELLNEGATGKAAPAAAPAATAKSAESKVEPKSGEAKK
jgi:thiol-disulfide isomerase/thioredoxin